MLRSYKRYKINIIMGIRQDIFKEFVGGCLPVATAMLFGLLFCLLITLCGCKAQKVVERVEVPVVVTQEHTIENIKIDHVRDTLIQRDSVFHYVQGDTVRIERWHYLQGTTNVIKVDTLIKTDSVPYPVTVVKTITKVEEVEKKLHWYQKLLIAVGGIALALGALGVAWKIGRRS